MSDHPSAPPSDYVIVRSTNAGVFAGTLVEHDRVTRTVEMANVRRIWYWKGAASLSELAQRGTSLPADCKFPAPVTRQIVAEVIEVLDVTPAARESIESVPPWSQ